MAMNIIEMAKTALNNGEVKAAGVIKTIADTSAWLASLPFNSIGGNSYAYDQEATLPGVAFRAVNEAYVESTGVVNPAAEALRICGGDLDCDVALVKMFGAARRSREEASKAKAIAHQLTWALIKGDSIADPRVFDGLELRLGGLQVVSNSAAVGGAALSLTNLDLAISRTANPTAIWIPSLFWPRFTAAARTPAVGGTLIYQMDNFGKPQLTYAGLPLVTAFPNNDGTDPITATEAYTGGGGATGLSVYVVSLTEGMLSGIQNGPIQVRDLGELNAQPVYRSRVEWLASIVAEHPRCATRLRDNQNAAFVA